MEGTEARKRRQRSAVTQGDRRVAAPGLVGTQRAEFLRLLRSVPRPSYLEIGELCEQSDDFRNFCDTDPEAIAIWKQRILDLEPERALTTPLEAL